MRISESQLRREIRSVIIESQGEHSILPSSDHMLASGFGSKVFGETITFEDFTLRIELDSRSGNLVDNSLRPIKMQAGEVLESDEVAGVIIAKFPFAIGDRFQTPALVAENIALILAR